MSIAGLVASICALALTTGCAYQSPNTQFSLAAGCFQQPPRAASDAASSPADHLPRRLR